MTGAQRSRSQRFTCRSFESVKRSPTQPCFRSNLYKAVEILVPVFARVVVIATGEFDEHARLIAHRPRIVTRWQQHDIVL